MKIKLMLTLALLSGSVHSQSGNKVKFGFQFNYGYTSYNLNDVRDQYREVVNSFNNENAIPIKVQKEFPANATFEAGVFVYLPYNLRISTGYKSSNTKAYALYGDYAGELDVIGEIKAYSLYVGILKYFPGALFLKPYLESNIGYYSGAYTMVQNIRMPQNAIDYFEKIEFTGNDYYIDFAGGVFYGWSLIEIHLKGGYRYAMIDDLAGTYENSNKKQSLSYVDMKMDLSGFFIMSGISFTLN